MREIQAVTLNSNTFFMLRAKAKLKFPFNTPHCNATIYAYRQAGIAGSILYIYGFEVLARREMQEPLL